MADVPYSISLSTFKDGVVVPSTFETEVGESSIVPNVLYSGVDSTPQYVIHFDAALSPAEQTTLTNLAAAHTPVNEPAVHEGGMMIGALETPSPSVEVQGTPGSTTWGYKVSAFSDCGESLASSEVTTTTGNATLNGTNFNRVTWPRVDRAIKYSIYRSTAGGTPSTTGLIYTTSLLVCADIGDAASGSEPSEDRSGSLIVGVDDKVPTGKLLDVREETTDDSTVTSLLTLTRRSTGALVAGFGTGLYVRLNDDADVLRAAGALHFLWSDPATAIREADFRVMLRDGGSTAVERARVTHDGRLQLSSTEVLGIGTCRAAFPPSAGIRGGNASASSNNDIASVTLSAIDESRIRWVTKPPANYTGGDLAFRALCSTANTPGNKDIRVEVLWDCLGDGDILTMAHSAVRTFALDSVSIDTLFAIDFTISSSTFSKTKDIMAFKFRRLAAHVDDDYSSSVHVHGVELRYTGYLLAGQAGQ